VSKSHPEQWTVREVAERPDRSLVTALREFATTQIADCGGPVAIMGPPLRHLAGGSQLCGPAVTVWTKPGDILYVLKAADLIAAGDVLVVDGGSRPDAAVIGDITGQALADLGCDGLVVDGAVRDLDGLDAAGLPTFALGAHPATGSNQGPGAINVVVQCGGVTVRPGDVVRGDASGLVVIPKEHLAPVLAMTKAVADRETGWRQAIARGASLPAAAGIDELISKLAADRAAELGGLDLRRDLLRSVSWSVTVNQIMLPMSRSSTERELSSFPSSCWMAPRHCWSSSGVSWIPIQPAVAGLRRTVITPQISLLQCHEGL
jgi:4-hydroxy-4-methyl-2-oxoglutarate aldolase